MAERFDDELQAALRDAIDAMSEPSEGFVDLVMAGYDLLAHGAELAELAYDSANEPLAIRSPLLDARMLRFEVGEVSVVFELRRDDTTILGSVDPVPATVYFEQDGESSAVSLADGRFQVDDASSSPLRFKVETAAGLVIVTEWVVP